MSLVTVEKLNASTSLLTLNRPEKRNALNIALLSKISESLDSIAKDNSIRAIILKGEGKAFCAGLDMEEAQDNEKAGESAHLIGDVLKKIYYSPAVTIAVVHGAAIAGGAGLMSACDFAIGAHDALFGYPEVRRGLVAGLVMTLLKRQVKERELKELLLLGELIKAEKAEKIGLINFVCEVAELIEKAQSIVSSILKGAPGALIRTKRMIDELHPPSVEEAIDAALDHHRQARASEEAKEGFKAFVQKREPKWTV